MRKLTEKDKERYLKFGSLTTPFLEDHYVKEMVMRDYNRRLKSGQQANIVESLICWIASFVKAGDDNFRQKYKFKRTAKEIWESGFATGCTDYALVFATLARQLGWPTTFLNTAELGWLQRLLNGENSNFHYGHSFCECYFENRWMLVDPTCRKIMQNYSLDKIELPYNVGPGNVYVPYLRGLDLGKKTSSKEHNLEMDRLCKKLKI